MHNQEEAPRHIAVMGERMRFYDNVGIMIGEARKTDYQSVKNLYSRIALAEGAGFLTPATSIRLRKTLIDKAGYAPSEEQQFDLIWDMQGYPDAIKEGLKDSINRAVLTKKQADITKALDHLMIQGYQLKGLIKASQ